jgi:3-hydroxymyristoyl/3-hydroxydecanoyl-(acyl carrier protein) dehydratase
MNPLNLGRLLPYGPDFLWVDEVLDVGPQQIRTRTFYSPDKPILQSHFLNGPAIVPGVILIEQVAQSACLAGRLAAGAGEQQADDTPAAAVEFALGQVKARFLSPAKAPCELIADVTLRIGNRSIGFRGKLFHGDTVIAEVNGLAVRVNL